MKIVSLRSNSVQRCFSHPCFVNLWEGHLCTFATDCPLISLFSSSSTGVGKNLNKLFSNAGSSHRWPEIGFHLQMAINGTLGMQGRKCIKYKKLARLARISLQTPSYNMNIIAITHKQLKSEFYDIIWLRLLRNTFWRVFQRLWQFMAMVAVASRLLQEACMAGSSQQLP